MMLKKRRAASCGAPGAHPAVLAGYEHPACLERFAQAWRVLGQEADVARAPLGLLGRGQWQTKLVQAAPDLAAQIEHVLLDRLDPEAEQVVERSIQHVE